MERTAQRIFYSLLLLLLTLAFSSHRSTLEAKDAPAVVERTVWMTLSDGVRLATDLYLPSDTSPVPALLMRTPYGKEGGSVAGRYFSSRGYAFVVQDCRGSGASEGTFYPYRSEGKDGSEAQEWIGTRKWSSGVVGTIGASYVGGTQWLTAPYRSPFVKAMAPVATFSNFYNNLYFGGAFRIAMAGGWTVGRTASSSEALVGLDYNKAFLHLPLVEMDDVFGWRIPMLRDWVSNDRYGDYWQEFNVEGSFAHLDVPALHIVGLYDFFLPETVKSYLLMERQAKTEEARRHQKLIIGPWDHGTIGQRRVGEIDFGPKAVLHQRALQTRWFDRHLKGLDNGIDREPPIRYFVMGVNDWREAFRWPPQETRMVDYFLRSAGNASTSGGDGSLGTEAATSAGYDTFVADPERPIPSKGGRGVEPTYEGAWGPFDQSRIEENPEVLVYTSAPLEREVEVAGPLYATLYIETDSRDTDVVVKLVDVFPNGYAQNLATGILRGRFRRSLSSPELLTPGEIYEWKVDMTHVSNRFRRGHRLRIDVAGSCFPLYDRNPNTGDGPRSKRARKARLRLHHSSKYRSRITLPVSTAVDG